MNKKALLYIPFLVFFLLLFLIYLFLAINSMSDVEIKEQVGIKSAVLFKTYQEAENVLFYLEESTKLANKETLLELHENAGYKEKECKKLPETLTDKNNYVLWNECPALNIEKTYFELLSKKLQNRMNQYTSSYLPLKENKETLPFNQIIDISIRKDIKLNKIYKEEDKLVLQFSTIKLPLEVGEGKYEIKEPKIYIDFPEDLSFYLAFHEILKTKKEYQQITESLNSLYQDISIRKEKEVIKLSKQTKINSEIQKLNTDSSIVSYVGSKINIAVDMSKELQPLSSEKNSFSQFSYTAK